jgi:hypothetical protein
MEQSNEMWLLALHAGLVQRLFCWRLNLLLLDTVNILEIVGVIILGIIYFSADFVCRQSSFV